MDLSKIRRIPLDGYFSRSLNNVLHASPRLTSHRAFAPNVPYLRALSTYVVRLFVRRKIL